MSAQASSMDRDRPNQKPTIRPTVPKPMAIQRLRKVKTL